MASSHRLSRHVEQRARRLWSMETIFPLTGPRFGTHIAIHTITALLMAPLASVTEYFLSGGLLRLLFRITDPGAPLLLPTFTVSVLSMSFTGVLTYWLVVGLYQSIHFYQAAMERQT